MGRPPNPDGQTPKRNIRVPNEIWDAAKEAAAVRGETVAAAVNRFLRVYASADQEQWEQWIAVEMAPPKHGATR